MNCKKTQDLSGYDPAKMKATAAEYEEKAKTLDEKDPNVEILNAYATYYYNMAAMFEKSTEDVSAKYASAGGYPFWDGNYTVFGQVFEGLDVLDKISAAEVTTSNTGEISSPVDDIIIASVKISEYVPPEPESSSSSKKK